VSKQRILVLCNHHREAAAIHYFSATIFQCVDATDLTSLTLLPSASAVIFCRELFSMPLWLAAVRSAEVPHYYFIDENVVTMRNEPHHHTHKFHRYGRNELQSELLSFAGVLVSSDALAQYMRGHGIHNKVSVLPPAVSALPMVPSPRSLDKLAFNSPRAIRIAFFSAQVRQGLFAQTVLPALRRLAHNFNIELIAFGCAPGSLDDASSPLRVRTPQWNTDYAQAIEELKMWNPEIIVQPDLLNESTPYKIPHMLISASQLGAVLVASSVAPYIVLARHGRPPLMLANDTAQGWFESLRLLLISSAMRHRIALAALDYVRDNWSASQREGTLAPLTQHLVPDMAVQAKRARRIFAEADSMRNLVLAMLLQQQAALQAQVSAVAQSDSDINELHAALVDSRKQLAIHALA
jgi:hypothetical protein